MIFDAGLILEGGGMRGVYTAGVLDFFLEQNIEISHCYGVSAGAINAINYLSKQKQRTFRTTVSYIKDKRYCSIRNLLTTGDLFGSDFLYNRIPNELDPFDYEQFKKSTGRLTAVVSNVNNGQAEYKIIKDLRTQMQWLRASSSLPLVSRMVEINNGKYLDGGITDSIPLKRSMEDGNQKNIVILTRHKGYQKKADTISSLLGTLFYFRYPRILAAGKQRHSVYNKQLELAAQQERIGNAYIIQPQKPIKIKRTEKDTRKLKALYEQGYMDAKKHIDEIHTFLNPKAN